MSEKIMQEMNEALTAVRSATAEVKKLTDEGRGGQSELKEKIEKANAMLDAFEKKNAEVVASIAAERKEREAMKEAMDELQVKTAKLAAMPSGSGDEKKMDLAAEVKSLRAFCEGSDLKTMEARGLEKKYLRSDSNVEGGFLMGVAYDDMILKPITEVSPIRQVARNKRIDSFSLEGAARESLVTTYWTGEGEAAKESNSTYRQPKIPTHGMVTKTKVTNRALLGSKWDLESEITGDMVESRIQFEGASFVNGNGVARPTGFMQSGLTSINSGSASTYDFDALIELTGELKIGYNPMYGFNRKEMAFIRTLEDGAGNYAWQAGNMAGGVPNTLNGYPYILIPDMPDKGSDAYPVIFADFMKLYTIVDSFQAIFLRNPYDTTGFVTFSLEGWVGGQVVMKEAGVLLKCHT